jgi:DNA-binding response OmpR family regulator
MKVLIIEDNQELARNIRDFLGREGYICESCDTLEAAKEKLACSGTTVSCWISGCRTAMGSAC